MKTRNSLVSNSSSSSFICHRPILEVATDMWKIVCNDWDHITKFQKKLILQNIKKICSMKNVQTGKYGVCFQSCNYDTYIIIKDGKCLIDTCNNEHFGDLPEMDYIDECELHRMITNKFFYHVHINNLLLNREETHEHLDKKIDFICPKCVKKWGKQDQDQTIHNNYYLLGIDNNKYCPNHYCKLREEKKDSENKNL